MPENSDCHTPMFSFPKFLHLPLT